MATKPTDVRDCVTESHKNCPNKGAALFVIIAKPGFQIMIENQKTPVQYLIH